MHAYGIAHEPVTQIMTNYLANSEEPFLLDRRIARLGELYIKKKL